MKKIDINELSRLCIINNEQNIKEKQITLKVGLQEEKCYVNADEEIKHIWDRFYKSDKARTNKVSIGLGLSIVRMIFMQQGKNV